MSTETKTTSLSPAESHFSLSIDESKLAGSSREHARQYLLGEIAGAEDYIWSLRTRANDYAEIHSLPDDILTNIFNLVVDEDHRLERQMFMNLKLSAVCRRWRGVALDSQLLWTEIDISNLVRAAAFLERSGTAPVDTYLDGGFYGTGGGDPSRVDGFGLWETLSPHAYHITSLYIEVPFTQMQALLESLDCAFNSLVNLRLLCPIEKGENRDSFQTIPYNPPSISAVQELDLYKVIVPWNSLAYAGLRDLDLRYQVSSPANAPTMDQFLNVLQRSPDLEFLRLAFAGPMLDSSFTTYPEPQRKVELRSLKSLTLYNHPLDIGHLLAHLDLPVSTCINIHAILSSSTTICDLFPRGCTLPIFDEITGISLGYTKSYIECPWEDLSLRLEGFVKTDPISRISVDFKWPEDAGNDGWAAGIPQTFRSLPIIFARSGITSLEVTCSYHAFTADDWRSVLSSFPELILLIAKPLSPAYYVPSANVEDLIEVLTPPLGPYLPVLCPELRQLKLGSFNMGSAFISTLMDCVSARKSRDAGLCMLKLGHFNWIGENEFTMPDFRESVQCRCGGDLICSPTPRCTTPW
ncbi:unnamed protein product [Somion occarium]|uniref:F-box domain-containing protein n=1 Tax=Somion occarium TaxID=3059160 RepID=A0ABP1DTA0_9APHY